jgi:hypothetical protein
MRNESVQEPLHEEERLLMDPETWDWDSAEEGVPVSNPGAILKIHFTRDFVARIEPAAHAERVTLHKSIEQAALARLPQEAPR